MNDATEKANHIRFPHQFVHIEGYAYTWRHTCQRQRGGPQAHPKARSPRLSIARSPNQATLLRQVLCSFAWNFCRSNSNFSEDVSLPHRWSCCAALNICFQFRTARQETHAITDTSSIAIAVVMKDQMLWPVLLISWTFMPKTEEARLMGTKANARTVT